MEFIKLKNENGLELTVTDTKDVEENYTPLFGGDDRNPSWDDYLSDFKEEFQPHILLIREAIEKLGWVGETADRKANDTLFSFSDGQNIGFSWRAWGDLMQAIVNKNEGYMVYYM
jgi:hypothetical protein